MKVGSKVTILYTMAATSVEVKPPAKETPAKPTDKPAKGTDKSSKGSDKTTKKKTSSGG